MEGSRLPRTLRLRLAAELTMEHAVATGLLGDAPSRRYLWTDAFAVCNALGLHRETGEGRWLDLALRLVDAVHHALGRHRPGDARQGWLSALPDAEAERHPTRGGLRIGKPLPERAPGERFDAELEWERDGQYFHYLTRWVHALHRVARETGQATFDLWAVELAARAHSAFTLHPTRVGPPRMVWKMSVDLSRPLVASMGHHDPLDALASWLVLRSEAPPEALAPAGGLAREIAEAAAMCSSGDWATGDPLGIGGLLTDAARLARLAAAGATVPDGLVVRLLGDALASLDALAPDALLGQPASRRLAFRELGLAIGLHAIEAAGPSLDAEPAWRDLAAAIRRHAPLGDAIERAWIDAEARRTRLFREHGDINSVMLATALAPGGYLG